MGKYVVEPAMLTAAQQDYVEVIYRLELERGDEPVRISDIAERLGTRLPTVTRTVQKLTAAKVVRHDSRKEVTLTEKGRQIGREIVHRHDDLVKFFVQVLGLSEAEAERDTCQIEHGLSGKASQRLHEFLVYLRELGEDERLILERFLESVSKGHKDFEHLPRRLTDGWRS
ncbi:MarR family transcriptional regulator [candidate division GN15 bacterium]|nr:MarR family transcriptional regulator [candidate division GN15 bacterium]